MSKFSAAVQALFIVLASLSASFGFWHWHDAPASGVALPQGAAVFETSLQSRITSTDTSMTLVANSVRGSSALSGYNCFTIDEGRTDMEYVCGSVSGTSVTSLERGIDPLTASTTNSTLKFAHRVGANVKITDFPLIQRMRHQLNGSDTILNVLKYDAATPDCASTNDICDYGFITGLAFSGASVLNASTVAKGVVEIATQIEAASSTSAGGTGALLVLPASSATSTYNALTAPLRLVMTGNTGKIDNNFINASTLFSGQAFSVGAITTTGVSNIASTSLVKFTASTSPTTTWTKQSNLKYVIVEVQGGGGGGNAASGNPDAGSGGGGGGYCKRIIPAAALGSTETVAVGGGGAAGASNGVTGGTSYFGSWCSAGGGVGGADTLGGDGGSATSGDINIAGKKGGPRASTSVSGTGGDSVMGFGGAGIVGAIPALAGSAYGGGGGGGSDSGTQSPAGASGAVGAVFVWEVYF